MRRFKFFLSVVFAATTVMSCGKDKDDDNEILQTGVEVTKSGTLSKEALKQYAPTEVQTFIGSDVTLQKSVCKTTLQGESITVSGLFIMPSDVQYQKPIFVFNHGTMFREDAPSLNTLTGLYVETVVACIIASVLKLAVLMPDYIGYGASESITHPYVHAETLGQSGLDFIKAYREYAEKVLKQKVSNKVILVGYSEGGYAAVALQKAIQQSGAELEIRKTYAGAGPYDQSTFTDALATSIDDELDPKTLSSFQWVLQTYKDYMGYAKPYDRIYSAADDAIFKAANYDFGYLRQYSGIHLNPRQLFLPEFIESVAGGTDTQLLSIISANSLTDFVPADSLIMFHSEADAWVPVKNTLNTYDKMKAANAPVRKEILPLAAGKSHQEAAETFFLSVLMNILFTGVIN